MHKVQHRKRPGSKSNNNSQILRDKKWTVEEIASFLNESKMPCEHWANLSGLKFWTVWRIRQGITKNPSLSTYRALVDAISR